MQTDELISRASPEPWEGDLARQTTQAKLLREARDQLAEQAPKMGKAWLVSIGLKEKRAKEITSGETFNSADLAEVLGVSLPTLRNWLAPADNKVHRDMPETAKRLLARILADERKRK